jgi:hypothetical protein
MSERAPSLLNSSRLLILGVVTVVIVAGLNLVIMAISGGNDAELVAGESINVLANSDDEWVYIFTFRLT